MPTKKIPSPPPWPWLCPCPAPAGPLPPIPINAYKLIPGFIITTPLSIACTWVPTFPSVTFPPYSPQTTSSPSKAPPFSSLARRLPAPHHCLMPYTRHNPPPGLALGACPIPFPSPHLPCVPKELLNHLGKHEAYISLPIISNTRAVYHAFSPLALYCLLLTCPYLGLGPC